MAKRFPPLPKFVDAPAGRVVIASVPSIVSDGIKCWGLWVDDARRIEIDNTRTLAFQWRVLFHELQHVALDDAGLSNGMHEDLVEAVCDATATQRFRERFG